MGKHLRILFVAPLVAAALALAACGNGDTGDAKASAAGAAGTVDIREFAFAPGDVTVKAGATVTWTNRDGFEHSVKTDSGAFETSPSLGQGATFSHTFARAGTYSYFCGIHNSMVGTIVVT